MLLNSGVNSRRLIASLWWLVTLALFSLTIACRLSDNILRISPITDILRSDEGLISYVGLDGNIYSVDKDGKSKKSVTDDAKLPSQSVDEFLIYQLPSWSQNGEQLAFIGTVRSADEIEKVSLFTADPDGNHLVEVFTSTEQIPFYLYWSPDSKHLTFLTSTEDENGLSLQIIPARGGERQVLRMGQPFYWVWSPDSQVILTHTGGSAAFNPNARLSFLNFDGEVSEDELDHRPAIFQAPDWSNDGERLLFAAETDDGLGGLFLTDRQGSVRKIVVATNTAVAFSWSPKGDEVAYIAELSPATQIFSGPLTIIDPDRPEEAIRTIDEQIIAFFWSPDGSKVAYYVPVIKTPGDELIQTGKSDDVLRLSLRILEAGTGLAREVALFTPTSQFLNILPFFDQYQRSDTVWSPDSRHVVYSAVEVDDRPGIYVVDASGEQPADRIADGQFAFWSWR